MTFAARTLGYLSSRSATLPGTITGSDLTGQGSGISASAILYMNYVNGTGSQPGRWSVYLAAGNTTTSNQIWLTGGGTGSDYDVKFDLLTGTLGGGSSAAATWFSLSTQPSWNVTRTASPGVVGTSTVTGTLSFRDASSLGVLATSSVTLNAEVA